MGFIWDYKSKRDLHEKITSKLFDMYKTDYRTIAFQMKTSQWFRKEILDPRDWNEYLDNLGCTRIRRTKTGWEYEDENTPRAESRVRKNKVWRSLNTPGYIHVSNPLWPGSYDHSEYVLRIPKEVAEKIMVLGFP